MSNIKGSKVAVQLAGLLICLLLIPNAFAAESLTKNVITENVNSDYITGNSTVTYVNPSEYSSYLSSGGNTQFTVTFTNLGNDTLTLTPKVVPTPESQNNIDGSWITISPTNAIVAPGAVQKFSIEENVPTETGSGFYQGTIAFTDDLAPNSANYLYSTRLDISVQAPPKIELQTSYIYENVEIGKQYEYNIKVKNIATKDITINPKLYNNNIGGIQAFDNNAIEISAPSTIKAGEVVNMSMRVSVPENAAGSYNGYIDMNVDGNVNDGSSPQLSLGFTVWQQPTVPFLKSFKTTTKDPVTIEVSYQSTTDMGVRVSPKNEEPSVKLGLKLNCRPVNMTLVKSVDSGYVSVGNYYPIWALENEDVYQNSYDNHVDTYKVSGEIGNWELSILPKNLNSFGYTVTIEDDKIKK